MVLYGPEVDSAGCCNRENATANLLDCEQPYGTLLANRAVFLEGESQRSSRLEIGRCLETGEEIL